MTLLATHDRSSAPGDYWLNCARSIGLGCAVAVYTVACGAFAILSFLWDPSGEFSLKVASFWSRLILWTAGVQVRAEGLENVRRDCTQVIIANHQSLFDIPCLMAHLPVRFRIIAKKSLFRVPFLGWYLSCARFISLDRGSPRESVAAIKAAAEKIASGMNVVIFAEGTRSTDGEVHEFKPGAVHLAMKAGVPIVPLTLWGGYEILPKGHLIHIPGLMRMIVGTPLDTSSLQRDDRDQVTRLVQDMVARNFSRAVAEDSPRSMEHR